jgi:low affinity Fe/Cu permease
MFGGSTVATDHSTDWVKRHWTSRLIHRVGDGVSHSTAGTSVSVALFLWFLVGVVSGFSDWWQTALYSISGAVTLVMVFVIQHTHQREIAAVQRKLDELVSALPTADDQLVAVEEAPDEDLQALTAASLARRQGLESNGPSGSA